MTTRIDTTSSPVISRHHDFLRNALPDWLTGATLPRIQALKAVKANPPEGHRHVTPATRLALRHAVQGHWLTQNAVDHALASLQDVQTFAKPLLERALKERFGLTLDVQLTWLRLYAPANTSWWVHDFKSAVNSRSVSLLDAALHNFAKDEHFSDDCEFISRPDARGHFQILALKPAMSIEQFKALCRQLNLGAQYARHLNEQLLPKDEQARKTLRENIILSQKAALKAAARMARISNAIDEEAFGVIRQLIAGHSSLNWKGQAADCYNLSLMDSALTGIVLIAPKDFSHTRPAPLIAWIPHDPQCPLKQYPNALEFMARLTRQLRDGDYQRFFSQFVDQHQRGHLFANLNQRLSQVKWQPAPPGSNLPSWRETPVNAPQLQFRLSRIQDDRQTRFNQDRWHYFYQQKLNKIFNDARELAISTEYADRMARWAWWDNLQKMLSDILNAALFVATPFVPLLGEMMMAYTAWQLLDGAFEGVLDLAEGRLAEAGEQALGVLESVVQLGAFAGGTALGQVAGTRLSSWVEGLQPVQMANGETKLWNPDLSPYRMPEQMLSLSARPDARGLHAIGDRQAVRVGEHLFEITQDPVSGTPRIRHPQRPDAYAPSLRHNEQGAWICETEDPRQWEGSTLMRRIGHRTDGLSDGQLEQIRQLTGTDENVLRRMHVENAPLPPLLADTLERLGSAPAEPAPRLSPQAQQVLIDCPTLTPVLAQRVVSYARPVELQQIVQRRRLPLRLRNTARELAFELQSVRAAQGLQVDALSNIDSERLLLGALRRHSDAFGALRIEIREASFDGDVRCTAGADPAERLRVLVRTGPDRYEVRDGDDQPLHAATGLYEAILQATEHDGRSALGYQANEGERLRQWIIAQTLSPRERRSVLASPPIRPVAQPETLQLLRGGALTKSGATLHERIEDLHPQFSRREIEAFADALIAKGEPLKAIETHETELREVRNLLHRWRYQQPDVQSFRRGGGIHIYERLLECFGRKYEDLGNRADPFCWALDLSSDDMPFNLQVWWPKRPEMKKYLDRITFLKLDKTRFSSDVNGLLKDFPQLVELSARGCRLSHIPKQIGSSMRRLERLRLSHNQIVLDAASVERLRNLTYLEVLRLENNPLGLLPDISRMPRLKVLVLKNTGLRSWPEGALARPRPRAFLLDLRGNPISELPEVVSGSDAQWLVARTRLDVGALSEINQVRYQAHRRAMQLPAEPIVSAAPTDNQAIISSFGLNHWGDVPGWGVDRETPWSELVDEPEAREFVRTILGITEHADYRAGGEVRDQLMQRVWRMVDAVHLDARLREKLFTMVAAPVDCADAGAQLFNSMGIHVLAAEAHAYTVDSTELEQKLVLLAKGAARLEHVNEIARADVASRGGNPDDVEVYLAYQTGLARRLGLPWQSEGMRYRRVSGVTDAMIDQAYDTALALGEGDGLVNKMLEQDFWQTWLEERHAVRLQDNKQRYQRLFERLETLIATQLEWLQTTAEMQRAALRKTLRELAVDLPIPDTVVFADEPISDAIYDRVVIDLVDEEKQLARSLTRAALRRAEA